ncbi:peptide-binding protein [Bacillus methanolicus]|uniref:peptide-binding protein n=1 Tax=Bacillus methanolicus TaxID=1471 RepID=UPI00238012DF|nr:peptide-binding protein [Bacillus methanolicus]MDE3838215.1 peptide-binding protein [Bacillus methanolicus]
MSFRKFSWMLLCLTFVFSLFLSACSSKETSEHEENDNTGKEKTVEPQKGGDLIVGSTGSPTLFNSLYSTDTASGEIEDLIYNGLVKADTKFNVQYDLAEDIQESEDGLTYTVKIKKGVKFHDGEELTADDVVFTYSIPLSPDYAGERGSNFEMIESIKKVDDYTVEFKLKRKDATFVPTTLEYDILPEHILQDVPIGELGEHEFNTKKPIGTGPFKFVEWKDGEYVKVEAFDDYFEGRPYLDSITYKIVPDANALIAQIQAGDIDYYAAVPGSDLETVKAIDGVKVVSDLALSYTFLGYNEKNPLFKDKKVRQAITHAIDREAIVESVMNGEGKVAHVPESPLSWAYSDDVPKFDYDPEKSKKLLEEAGWKDTDGDGILDKDGKKFSFTVKTNQGNKVREDIVVVLQQQLKEVGIEAKPEIVEWSAFIDQISAPNWKYDALVLGWALSTFPDQYDVFHSSQREQGLNLVWWSNKEADKLMEDARQILDKEEYKKAYSEIYKIIAEEQPYTFLYYPKEHRAMPENLQGFEFHARNPFWNVHKWWLKQ